LPTPSQDFFGYIGGRKMSAAANKNKKNNKKDPDKKFEFTDCLKES
jgi:hypothetical protein